MEIYLPFRVEHEVFKLVETIKKQSETIEQLERKLAAETQPRKQISQDLRLHLFAPHS